MTRTQAPTQNCPNLISVFEDRLEAERAVDELEQVGFRKDEIGFAIRGSDAVAGGMITEQGLGTRFVMSLGAGVWEETVFRLGIMTGVAVLLERVLGLGRWVAVAVALIVSAVLFSAMHHIPPYGDALHIGVFVFRVLAGCFFGLVYWFRGFAIVVYTHALYDVYVLLVR